MADCGCETSGCDCRIIGGDSITVTGLGTAGAPYVISARIGLISSASLKVELVTAGLRGKVQLAPLLAVSNSPTGSVNLAMSGAGTEESPFVLSASMANVNLSGAKAGDHLVRLIDGTWGPGPANPIPAAGAPATAGVIVGDGTGADPIRYKRTATYAELEAAPA